MSKSGAWQIARWSSHTHFEACNTIKLSNLLITRPCLIKNDVSLTFHKHYTVNKIWINTKFFFKFSPYSLWRKKVVLMSDIFISSNREYMLIWKEESISSINSETFSNIHKLLPYGIFNHPENWETAFSLHLYADISINPLWLK